MKKTVLVVNFFPALTPPKSGGEIRYYQMYRNLGRHYSIELLNPTHPFVDTQSVTIASNVNDNRIPKTNLHVRLHKALDRVGGFSECSALVVSLAVRFHKEFLSMLRYFVSKSDIIICEFPFIPFIRLADHQVFFYNSYNVEYDMQKSILKGLLGRAFSLYIKRLERKTCRKADAIFATSDRDKERFIKLYTIPPEKIVVVPNGVDSADLQPVTRKQRTDAKTKLGFTSQDNLALFFGSNYPPNKEAVSFILEHLAPQVRSCNFLLAGGCSTEINVGENFNVHPYGIVSDEDKKLLLAASDIAINPMFSGSGTNLKLLDYLAMGLPIITTPVGARGVDVKNKTHAIIAPEQEFAGMIRDMLTSPTLSENLRANARALVEQKYDWKQISDVMYKTIEKTYHAKNYGS